MGMRALQQAKNLKALKFGLVRRNQREVNSVARVLDSGATRVEREAQMRIMSFTTLQSWEGGGYIWSSAEAPGMFVDLLKAKLDLS